MVICFPCAPVPGAYFFANWDLLYRWTLRTFLVSARKEPKEADLRGASSKCAPLGIPSRIAIQHSKMYRFLNAFILQTCKLAPQSPLKIGTFSAGGGQKRREWGPGEVVLRAANLNRSLAGGKRSAIPVFARNASPRTISLVTFLFGHKKVTPIVRTTNCNLKDPKTH